MIDADSIWAVLTEDGSIVVAKVGDRETALVTTDSTILDEIAGLASMLPAGRKLRLVEYSYHRVIKEIVPQ